MRISLRENGQKRAARNAQRLVLISARKKRVKWQPKILSNCESASLFLLEEFLFFPCQNRSQFERVKVRVCWLNPIGYVPVLVDGDIVLADSLAILLYLEEKYPQHPLLPSDLKRKAINFQAANIVSMSIQPLQNVDVLEYIKQKVGQEDNVPWVEHHVGKVFAALEELLKSYAGRYATGDEVFLADLFLAPQLHSAIKRFNLDMTKFPLLSRLNEAYSKLPAFEDATLEKQPDAPSSSTS